MEKNKRKTLQTKVVENIIKRLYLFYNYKFFYVILFLI